MFMTPKQIITAFGGTSEVAKLCECTPQAVSQWFGEAGIPKARLLFLKAIRPEVFAKPTPQPQQEVSHG